jgi:hypothetical protein
VTPHQPPALDPIYQRAPARVAYDLGYWRGVWAERDRWMDRTLGPCDDTTDKEEAMPTTVTAAQPIDYDPRTDVIEPTDRTYYDDVPGDIEQRGYEVVSREVMGWGPHNAIIRVEDFGYWLATLTETDA